jgi:L-2-hydroxyglutarate oxidase LhgO
LARAGRDVIVVESQDCIGSGISSRNSEVIHAGIYYPSGLDKARWFINGEAMLCDFCREYHAPHRQCGKLLVAASEAEINKLSAIKARAEANGVTDLVLLSGEEARALEPALTVHRALLSPSTGIIDSHALMHALRGDAERYGAMVAPGRIDDVGIIVENRRGEPNTNHRKCRSQRCRAWLACLRPLYHWNGRRQDSAPSFCEGKLLP